MQSRPRTKASRKRRAKIKADRRAKAKGTTSQYLKKSKPPRRRKPHPLEAVAATPAAPATGS